MKVTLAGIVMFFTLSQLLKARSPMVLRPVPSQIVTSSASALLPTFWKALAPMVFTVLGRVMAVRAVQPLKAFAPMAVTVYSCPSSVTVEGITTSPSSSAGACVRATVFPSVT